jgi:outer membrane protein TolC
MFPYKQIQRLNAYTCLFVISGNFLCCAAYADTLPWLVETAGDPFATERKAANLVELSLVPEKCQTPDTKQPLKLNDVVVGALCGNPETKAAYLSLVAQAASHASNYSSYFPSVTATMSRDRTGTFSGSSKTTEIGRNHGLDLGWTLYDFGQREFRLEAAEQALVAAGYNYNSALQATIAVSLRTYYNLLTAQNAVTVAKDAEKFAQESYEAATLRHDIGQAPLADKLQAKGTYSQSLLDSQVAENGLSLQQAVLATLLGLSADVAITVSEIDNDTLAKDPFGEEIKFLMAKAKEQRKDLQATRATIKASETSLKALERANTATVSVTANMDMDNDEVNVLSRTSDRSQAIGLSVSIPIFAGFSHTYNERNAKKQLEAQRTSLVKRELDVEQDVWNAWHNYETAKRSWETSKDQLKSAVQLKDVALGRYKEGLGSILDVLNAKSQYSSALQSQLVTRQNLLTTRVDLIRAVGVLNLDTMEPTKMVSDYSVKNEQQ